MQLHLCNRSMMVFNVLHTIVVSVTDLHVLIMTAIRIFQNFLNRFAKLGDKIFLGLHTSISIHSEVKPIVLISQEQQHNYLLT